MIAIRKATDRGHANYGWLDTWYSFSFADYFDPQHEGFRSVRVINDDTIAGGAGFDMHPHRDMEIITYVLSGALRHRDSMGHEAVMKAEDVQRISAGTGIRHSEFNDSPIEPVHLLQMWVVPDKRGGKPDYAETSVAKAPMGALHLIASKSGREQSIGIQQDADVFVAKLAAGDEAEHLIQPGRHAWVQVATGEMTLNGKRLVAGDGASVSDERSLKLVAASPVRAVVFDVN
jgi:redox-sensitive bicupin YhaK (pirin superfamily)